MGLFLDSQLCYTYVSILETIPCCLNYRWFIVMQASLAAQLVKNLSAMQRTQFNSWVEKIFWRRDRLHTPVFLGFPDGSAGKESACNEGVLGLLPGLGRSSGEGKGYPLHSSILAWRIPRKQSDTTEQLSLSFTLQ